MLELSHEAERNIVKQAMRFGHPIPERIANSPELKPGLQLYLQAFFDLDSERSHAFSPTAIPWSSIQDYAKAFDIDGEQREDLFYLVKQMDRAHLSRLDSKSKK
jgi:hypothetical protein